MTPRFLIIISVIFFSCNNTAVNKQHNDPLPNSNNEIVTAKKEEPPISIPADTASTDYLMYLLKNEKGLNDHWTKKLKALDVFLLPLDSMSRVAMDSNWVINDSIAAMVVNHATGVSLDKYLLIIKNKKDIVSKLHVSNESDSDVSEENPDYYYMKYKLINDRKIKLFNHEIRDYDRETEKDTIVSVENWLIQDNGMLIKK
jgi:hypothetical protein